MEVVAEGIETELQLDQLRALHCEQGQGFYFSVPVDVASATALIEKDERGEVLRILEPDTGFGGLGMIEKQVTTLA
jgi:predicted signal transduction protein with EAL and GGDEF domain